MSPVPARLVMRSARQSGTTPHKSQLPCRESSAEFSLPSDVGIQTSSSARLLVPQLTSHSYRHENSDPLRFS